MANLIFSGNLILKTNMQLGANPDFLNPAIKYSGITLSNNDLTATASTAAWGSTYGIRSRDTGKYAFEFTSVVTNHPTLADVLGISETPNSGTPIFAGNELTSWGVTSVGEFYHNNSFTTNANGVHNQNGDTFMVMVDLDAGDIFIVSSSVGTYYTAWTSQLFAAKLMFPQLSVFGNTAEVTVNFGSFAFANGMPGGYSSWDGFQTVGVSWDMAFAPTRAVLSNGALDVFVNDGGGFGSVIDNLGHVNTGKYAFEIEITAEAGVDGGIHAGLAHDDLNVLEWIGNGNNSGLTSDNKFYSSNVNQGAHGLQFLTVGDIVQVQVDFDIETVTFEDTSAGTYSRTFAQCTITNGVNLYAASSARTASSSSANFGATAFAVTMPANYTSWDGSQTA